MRHARFMFDRDKRDFAAAHGLVRRVLSMHADIAPADWQFDGSPNQKPRVAAHQAGTPPLSLSLSHTHGLVACAVARGVDVGIDVELVDRVVDAHEVARRFFAPKEIAMLDGCADAEERSRKFVELWTLKEAYVKAIGRGLVVPLDEFCFTIDAAGSVGFEAGPEMVAGPFAFALLSPLPTARVAVAVRCDDPAAVRIVGHEWPDAARDGG
jgi:4'-phosphopantetheinyl transferase